MYFFSYFFFLFQSTLNIFASSLEVKICTKVVTLFQILLKGKQKLRHIQYVKGTSDSCYSAGV